MIDTTLIIVALVSATASLVAVVSAIRGHRRRLASARSVGSGLRSRRTAGAKVEAGQPVTMRDDGKYYPIKFGCEHPHGTALVSTEKGEEFKWQ